MFPMVGLRELLIAVLQISWGKCAVLAVGPLKSDHAGEFQLSVRDGDHTLPEITADLRCLGVYLSATTGELCTAKSMGRLLCSATAVECQSTT